MRSRDRLLKITDLYQQNQDYRSQRLQKITLGLQAKRTRLQPRCGPLAMMFIAQYSPAAPDLYAPGAIRAQYGSTDAKLLL